MLVPDWVMWAKLKSMGLAVLFTTLLLFPAAAVRPCAWAQQHVMQQQQQAQLGSSAMTAATSFVGDKVLQGPIGHKRALSESPEPWQNPDWINQQIQAITNMIISSRDGGAPSSGLLPNASSTTVGEPATTVAPRAGPAAAAAAGTSPDGRSGTLNAGLHAGLNIASSTSDSDSSSNGQLGALGQLSFSAGFINSTTGATWGKFLDSSLLPGTRGNSSWSNSSGSGLSHVAVTAAASNPAGSINASGGTSYPAADKPGNSMQSHTIINVTNTTAAAAPPPPPPPPGQPATAAAAAASVRAVQLMSLLSDLQPSNTTSPFTKVDYGYNVFNTSGNMPLAVPVINIPDLPVSRWVLAAWSISNSFTALTLEEGDAQDRRDMLLGNFTQLQPQQVQVAVTANVTLPLLFTGVEWKRPASKALQQAASDAAGGYTQAFVQVDPVEPEYGATAADFLNQDVQYSGDGVSDKAVTLSYIPAPDISNSSSNGRQRFSRKLLQQQQQQQLTGPPAESVATVIEPMVTRVWVQYQRVDATNVTALLAALADAFSMPSLQSVTKASQQQWQQQQPVWNVSNLSNLTGSLFGAYTRRLLHLRGARVENSSYAVFLNRSPVTTVNIRIATAVTDNQTSPTPSHSTDQLVALWLANASNIIGPTHRSAAPIGVSALVSWLLTPEVWTQPQQLQPLPAVPTIPQAHEVAQHSSSSSGLSPGATAGVAVAGGITAALLAGLMVYQADRRRKQHNGEHKAEHSAGPQRKRRRHHAKPRYLLPDPPHHPPSTGPPTAAAAAAAAAVDECVDDLSPDQLRAELRELGDSVTSAARFELHEQQSEGLTVEGESGVGPGPAIEVRVDDQEEPETTTATASSMGPSAALASSSDHQQVARMSCISALALEHALAVQQAQCAAGRSAAAGCDIELGDAESSQADQDDASSLMLVTPRAGWQPGDPSRPGFQPENLAGPDTSRRAAAPHISPTTASLALTGAFCTPRVPPLLPSPAAAAGPAIMPCQQAGQLLTAPAAVFLSQTARVYGMQTPFANYVFDNSMQPAAAVTAISAAYTKGKDNCLSRGSSSSYEMRQQPFNDQWCCSEGLHTPRSPGEPAGESPNFKQGLSGQAAAAAAVQAAAAAVQAADRDALRLSVSLVPLPPTPQPTSKAIRLPSMSPQRQAHTQHILPAVVQQVHHSATMTAQPKVIPLVTNSSPLIINT